MRVVFMGTPDFSVPTLQALVDAGHDVVAVYTQPPRPAGRGKGLRRSAVHERADALGIDVRCPVSMKNDAEAVSLAALKADIGVVVAFGQILPQAILDAPREGCLNIHASLLPRWRGAAPIQRAIEAGDSETGVCIMQMDAGLDTGPVRARAALPIGEAETGATLHDRLSALGASEIVKVLADLTAHPPQPQSEAGVTYAKKIHKAEARIDWTRGAVDIDRKIRALSPFPGAWSEHEGNRIKLLMSGLATGKGSPGEVIGAPLAIACGDGAISVLRLQRSGRGAAAVDTFLLGYSVAPGDLFD